MAFYRRFLFISGSLGLRKVLVQLFQSAGRFLSVIGIIIKDGTEDNEIDEVTLCCATDLDVDQTHICLNCEQNKMSLKGL
jgi:hypothetical protein